MVSGTSADGSGSPVFRGVRKPNSGGVWENAFQPVRGVLDRPSASSPELFGADEMHFPPVSRSMNGTTSSVVTGTAMLNDTVTGAPSAPGAARSPCSSLINRRDGQPPKGRSSAPDDDIPQIASAFGLLDPRPIIHQ